MGPTIGNAFSFQSTRSDLYRVYGIVKKALWTDGPIDRPTDRPYHRDARFHFNQTHIAVEHRLAKHIR